MKNAKKCNRIQFVFAILDFLTQFSSQLSKFMDQNCETVQQQLNLLSRTLFEEINIVLDRKKAILCDQSNQKLRKFF